MHRGYLCLFATLICGTAVQAQTFTATRLDGNSGTTEFDPLIDGNTFATVGASGGSNINGPSVIRVPDWIPAAERINPSANYYMYFANHTGDDIRLAWSDSVTGTWTLFNAQGGGVDRASGVGGSNTGTQTPGNGVIDLDLGGGTLRPSASSDVAVKGHIASPDVFVDNANQRIVMYFHGPGAGQTPNRQNTYVSTSKYGLNFNPNSLGGETRQGMREVVQGESYFSSFTVSGQTFAFSNQAQLWKAPATNDNGDPNTIANADTEGGLWNPVGDPNTPGHYWENIDEADNPFQQYYINDLGENARDPRHVSVYSRTHRDPSDTNLYLFYSARDDSPESILLSVIDTDNGSTDPANWAVLGQDLILEPALDWEGADLPITVSQGGAATNVRQLRDPFFFEDTQGTADLSDDRFYLFYTGEGEEAIGVAELMFVPEPSSAVALLSLAGLLGCQRRMRF